MLHFDTNIAESHFLDLPVLRSVVASNPSRYGAEVSSDNTYRIPTFTVDLLIKDYYEQGGQRITPGRAK